MMNSSSSVGRNSAPGRSHELDKFRKEFIDAGIEVYKYPRYSIFGSRKPWVMPIYLFISRWINVIYYINCFRELRVIQLNASEGYLYWVGKGGERKIVQLDDVMQVEAAATDNGVVSNTPFDQLAHIEHSLVLIVYWYAFYSFYFRLY